MKVLFLILFTFIFGVSYAQEPVYNQMRNNYQFKGIRVDSLLLIPKFNDTTSANATKLDSIHGNLIRVNTKFYYRDTLVKKWIEFGAGGGGSTDTTSLSNRINAKADTSLLNGVVYFTDTLTTIATISDIKGDSPDMINGKATANVTANMANKMLIIDTVSIFNARSYLGDSSALLSVTGGGVNLTASEVSSGYLSGISVTPKDSRIGSSSYFNVQNNQDTMYFKWGSGGKIYVPLIGGTDTVALVSQLGGGGQNGRFGNDTATILMAKVHNDAGSTLTNGEVVYLSTSGTSSDAPSVRRAVNKGDSASANTFGFVHGTINANDTGWIVLYGKIEKLNTSAFANGDVIYLDSIPGKWTKTKPKAPYHLVYLGAVIKSNPGNGSIFAKVQNGYELDEIHDVQINNKLNNQILVYSDTQKIWKNRDVYSVVDTTQLSARIDTKQPQLDGTGFVKASGTTISYDNNTYVTTSDYDWFPNIAYTALGSTIKGFNMGIPTGPVGIQTSTALSDAQARYVAYYINKTSVISGVRWYQNTAGNYTGDNYNGFALYSYSGGTLTMVASTTNDANIWKGASASMQSKAFSSQYTASPGVYFIGFVYNQSAQITAPGIGTTGIVNAAVAPYDFTNSAKITSAITNQATLSSSISSSSLTASPTIPAIFLY